MKRVGLLSITILLVFALASMALASDLEIVVVDNSINPGEAAEFEVTITNTLSETQDYTLYSLSTVEGWQVDPTPLSDKVVEAIGPGESREVTILATPTSSELEPGIYQLSLEIEGSLESEANKAALKVYLGSGLSGGSYLPSISTEIEMDDRIEAFDPMSVVIHLRNGNARDLSALTLRVESDVEEFNLNLPIGLEGFEEKTAEFSLNVDQYTSPRDYILFFVFEHEGETVKVVDKRLEVEPYVPDFAFDVSKENTFLKQDLFITLTNEGNAGNTQEYLYPLSLFSSFFVSSETGSVTRIDGQSYILFETSVDSGESIDVAASVNYRVLFYLLLFVGFLLVFYLLVRSPVAITKKGMVLLGDEDGVSEVKVMLEIRNKRKYPLSDVEILDQVPGIANVQRTLQLGTLKPDKVAHSKQGSKIYWSLKELDSFEQRIITYRIKAKLSILGKFSLPRAEISYTNTKGKQKKSYSNLFLMDTNTIKKQH